MAREQRSETLEMLVSKFDALTRAGRDSLVKAYEFGAVVDALHRFYSYSDMGNAVGRSGSQVYTYAKLFRRYSSEQRLVKRAEELDTYDVARLAKDEEETVHYHYQWRCTNCHSTAVVKEREAVVPEQATAGSQ